MSDKTVETAAEIAGGILTCSRFKDDFGGSLCPNINGTISHDADCPGAFREDVAAAIEAAERRGYARRVAEHAKEIERIGTEVLAEAHTELAAERELITEAERRGAEREREAALLIVAKRHEFAQREVHTGASHYWTGQVDACTEIKARIRSRSEGTK